MTRTDTDTDTDGGRRTPVRGVVLVAGALSFAVVIVALIGGPSRTSSDDEPHPVAPVVDEAALSAWCRQQPPRGTAASIGGTWECVWSENGFFRHTAIGDGPCNERFGPTSAATASSADGLRCSTP